MIFWASPEGELAIAQAVIYVATAPKSNAAYMAYGAAMRAAKEGRLAAAAKHILNAPTKLMKSEGYGSGYYYDHDTAEAFSGQDYFPGSARPPEILRSARARLRARDQEAAGVLGRSCGRSAVGMNVGLLPSLRSCVPPHGLRRRASRSGTGRPNTETVCSWRAARRAVAGRRRMTSHADHAALGRRKLHHRQDVQGRPRALHRGARCTLPARRNDDAPPG